MNYPILEYDPSRDALIEPSQLLSRQDVPVHCVICFFKEVTDKVVCEHDARILAENRWEDGPHPLYEISHKGQRLAFFHPGVGAPMAAGLLVEMEAAGMMAVAQFRGVVFAQVLYGGDDVSGEEWDRREWQSRAVIRENLFWLCADACLSL